MATGIEMLGQMGTDQSLAGPVQGGNMVVKPNQVPVGGAAMLSKALRRQADKGVGGMYVLPEQEESMPGFMQMAQQNVNEDMTRMARTVEAEAPPGHMLSYITPEEAGILKLLGGTGDINPVTGIPQFPPQTEEQAMRTFGAKKASSVNKSSDRQPGGRAATEEVGKQYEADVAEVGVEKAQERFMERGREAQKDPSQFAPVDYFGDKEEIEEETVSTSVNEVGDKISKLDLSENEKLLVTQAQNELTKGNKSKAQSIIDSINNKNLNAIFDSYTPKKGDSKEAKERKKKGWGDMLKMVLSPASFGMGILSEALGQPGKDDILAKIEAGESLNPDEQNVAAGLKLANMENPGVLTDEQLKMIEEGSGFTSEDKIREMIASYKGGEKMGWTEGFKALGKGGAIRPDGSISGEGLSKALSRADKRMLKSIDPEMWADMNFANTSGGHEALGQQQYIKNKVDADGNKIALTDSEKAFNRSVMESREIAGRQRDRQGGGGGRPRFMDAVEEEVIETPTGVVDEEAQTMAYTGPRTGGVETQVPLQRRFTTDPTKATAQYTTTPRTQEDIYKYMTEGTTGEGIGLEPFSEYQKRRRKALGYEPLGLWS